MFVLFEETVNESVIGWSAFTLSSPPTGDGNRRRRRKETYVFFFIENRVRIGGAILDRKFDRLCNREAPKKIAWKDSWADSPAFIVPTEKSSLTGIAGGIRWCFSAPAGNSAMSRQVQCLSCFYFEHYEKVIRLATGNRCRTVIVISTLSDETEDCRQKKNIKPRQSNDKKRKRKPKQKFVSLPRQRNFIVSS